MVELKHFLIQQQKEYVVLTIKYTYICVHFHLKYVKQNIFIIGFIQDPF